MLLTELAQAIGATVFDPTDSTADAFDVVGIAPIYRASGDQITFLTSAKFQKYLATTKAGAIILKHRAPDLKIPQLIHANPAAAMGLASAQFFQRHHVFEGHSAQAFIHPTAEVHPTATVHPFCYIEKGAKIGAHSVLYPMVHVGTDCTVGEFSVLYPQVVMMEECHIGNHVIVHGGAVIGADGFGFAPTPDGIVKIPQTAGVIVHDHVEIGPLVTIDRGAFENTVIGKGCKLDSQVHIAHGVEVGEWSMIAAQSGVAGSAKIGRRLMTSGHIAIGPGLEIADNVIIGPKSAVTASIEEGGEYIGFPAGPGKEWRKQVIAMKKLPELLKTMQRLETRVAELEQSKP